MRLHASVCTMLHCGLESLQRIAETAVHAVHDEPDLLVLQDDQHVPVDAGDGSALPLVCSPGL